MSMTPIRGGVRVAAAGWRRWFGTSGREQLPPHPRRESLPLIMTRRVVGTGLVLCLAGLIQSQSTFGGTVTWNGSGDNNWFNANNWTPVGVPATNDTIIITSGTINLTAPVTIAGVLNWSGGTLSGNLFFTPPSGLLTLTGTGTKTFANVLTNAGTVVWSGGTVYAQNYAPYGFFGAVENLAGGLWDIQCDQGLNNNYGVATAYFHNAGTVQKTVGTGTATFGIAFNNAGLVSVQTGTINFNNGG